MTRNLALGAAVALISTACAPAEAGTSVINFGAFAVECSGGSAMFQGTKTSNSFDKPMAVCKARLGGTSAQCSWGFEEQMKKATKSLTEVEMTGALERSGKTAVAQFIGGGRILSGAFSFDPEAEPGIALLGTIGFAPTDSGGVVIARACNGRMASMAP